MTWQVNLFNPAFKRQKKYLSALTMVQALLLIAVGISLFYVYASRQVALLEKSFVESDHRLTAAQAQLATVQAQYSPEQESLLLENELKKIEAHATTQQALVDTLKNVTICNTQGYSEYMRAFARQIMNGLWLTRFDLTENAAQISISGGALSPDLIPTYVQKLGQEKIMLGKSFSSLQMQQPKTESDKLASLQILQPKTESDKAVHYLEFTLQSVDAASNVPGNTQ